eukprot:365743-Chlamydomonas_euryale.AAC.39
MISGFVITTARVAAIQPPRHAPMTSAPPFHRSPNACMLACTARRDRGWQRRLPSSNLPGSVDP